MATHSYLKKEGSKFRRGYVGVRYGTPATLQDAANYVHYCIEEGS